MVHRLGPEIFDPAESFESSKVEAESLQRILPTVDGVIFGTTRLADAEIYEANREKPVVLINRLVEGVADVVPDNEPGIAEAIAHLAGLGHKHIGFLGGPTASWINTDRWNLLMKHAVDAGMTVVSIGPNLPTVEGGRDALDQVRASGVSAIITYNDLMGIGLLRAATAAGVQIPQQLSIIGFDNIFGSDFTSPPLTTIEMPLEVIGGNAVLALLKTFEATDDAVPHGSNESTSLLVRGSTAEAKA